MNIGFTGTRKGFTFLQGIAISNLFDDMGVTEFHHGDCIGSDKMAGDLAKIRKAWIVIHPPTDPKYRAFCKGDEIREEKPYMVRDHDIVDETEFLIATPKGFKEELRSGTWATVRYAKKQNKTIIFVFPDGQIRKDEGTKVIF